MTSHDSAGDSAGHFARRPREIPRRGWKQIVLRVKDQLAYDHVMVVSAGVAFFFFLALFPAFAALVSIYGLVVEPAEVEQQLGLLTTVLPAQAHQLLTDILRQLAAKSENTLGWSLLVSILLSLWSANKGIAAVFEGVNIAYNEQEGRNFFLQKGLTLLFTLGGVVVLALCLSFIVGFPALVDRLSLPAVLETAISWLRWPVLFAVAVFSLALIYKIAPHRRNPEFRWVSWGAVSATVLWLSGSLLFSLYVNHFDSIDNTYGSFAAVIILMLWFLLTAWAILLGAEINSEMEHQTARDSTVGPDKPIGRRDAWYADHVAGELEKGERKN